MHSRLVVASVSIGIVLAGLAWVLLDRNRQGEPPVPKEAAKEMKLTSSAFAYGDLIPERFSCRGVNINPALSISAVPSSAKSISLVIDDPDAPLGTFTHWLVWNIAPQTTEIAEGSVPSGAQQGTNSLGKIGYTGPCPPARHRYFFKLYALDAAIGLDGKAKAPELETAMKGHIVAEASLIGVYGH